VRFTVITGAGTLAGGAGSVDVTTGADGLATVDWQPDSVTPNQTVEATLISGFEAATPPLTAQFVTTLNLGGGGGVACSVTVGKGGQFATLPEAVKALLRPGAAADVALCLLPGDHLVEEGLDLSAPDEQRWHLKIEGAGRGTRILLRNKQIIAQGLASLALRHLDLRAEKVERPLQISDSEEFTLEDCHLEQLSLPTALMSIERVLRVDFHASTLASYIPELDELLGGIDRLEIKKLLVLEPDPVRRLHLLAVRLFEVEKEVAKEAVSRILEFGLGQPGISDRADREYRELTERVQREIIAAEPGASPEERRRAWSWAVQLLFRILLADALVLGDARADLCLDHCHLHGRLYLYGIEARGISLDQFLEQGRRVVAGGLELGPFQGELRLHGCRLTTICIDETVVDLIENDERWANLYRACHLTENEFTDGSINLLLGGHVVLEANRFPFAIDGEPAVITICQTATLVGNSGPTKASLLLAVPGTLGSGAAREAANHLVVADA
jgi:hypothetical protein